MRFEETSKTGIAEGDVELIRQRLKQAIDLSTNSGQPVEGLGQRVQCFCEL